MASGAAMMHPRPHDLLLVSDTAFARAAPPWVHAALQATPWVVVRRGSAPPDYVAVGVRGPDRLQRHATTVPYGHIRRVAAPETLVQVVPPHRDVLAIRALHSIRARMQTLGLPWGPTGSVGFELASGVPTATPDSDLDLVIRVDDLSAPTLGRLTCAYNMFERLPARVDCQLELPCGAVALAELLSGRSDVLARTCAGPRLAAPADLLR
jgi:phosphoribosyl-dephospho-CoA transferase